MSATAARVFTGRFDDPEQTSQALRGGAVEYISFAPTGYAAELLSAEFGGVVLQQVHDHAHMARGQMADDRFSLLFRDDERLPDPLVNGARIGARDAVLLAPGADLGSIVRDRVDWFGVILSTTRFEALLDLRGAPPIGGFRIASNMLAAAPGLQRIARECATLARHDPDRLGRPSVIAAIEDEIEATVGEALRGLAGPAPRSRQTLSGIRLVRRAEEFLDARLGRPVYTQEICAALGVGPHAMAEAFNTVYGMSVHRVLRLRRLHAARRRLREGDPGTTLVKVVALDLGFWHFGRFSQSYRDLFGETPSETLARR